MPPPSPYNLNRWFVVGATVMIVAGFFAAKRSKPAFEFEKVAPEAAPSAAPDTGSDASDVAPE
jgi:hypothetical protein